MQKIGIICAADRELNPFLPHITDCKTFEKAMLTFYEGTINGVNIVALYCGVCKTNAALATQILIDTYNADAVINAGTAGGMDSKLNLLDTVICTEAAYHDVHEDVLTQFHPWMPSVFFKSDAALLELSKTVADKFTIHYGRMVTGEAFITDDGRDHINSAFAPLSVDMETASIAHVCYVNKIPFIAVRTITDTADHSGKDNFEVNCDAAANISKDIVLAMLHSFYHHSTPLNK